ncbi:M48 family metallopeptidase [Thalassotalea maritima]|uniref:M48 family metallopeptidase n=1 Tax=Thalassotalea maritima TaxID=3242416 RepID=UPI0035299934
MKPIEYQLVRSGRRKSISLQVKQGQVRVLAPDFVETSYIEKLLLEKQTWLQQKIALYHQPDISERGYCCGETFYWLGQPLLLTVSKANANSVEILPERLSVKLTSRQLGSQQHVKKALHQWYKTQAEQILSQRLLYWQQKTQLYANQLTVRYFKSRWGSCDSKSHIKLNWLLVMAPMWVIDYVIVHELCHIQHLNHSNEFWQLVSSFEVEHVNAKRWLQQHQQHLYWQH